MNDKEAQFIIQIIDLSIGFILKIKTFTLFIRDNIRILTAQVDAGFVIF